jgi:ribonuclease Z
LDFEVKIIGSNSASFAYGRHHTSQLVSYNGQPFIVDCGEGTQILLLKHKIKLSRLTHIFISHLHGDHYLGLLGLISSMHLGGRTQDLYVFGPRGLDEIITLQLRYSETRLNYKLYFKEVVYGKTEVIYENDFITIENFPLQHRIPCSGFIFREKPGRRRILPEKLPFELSPYQLVKLKNGEDLYDTEGSLILRCSEVTAEPKPARSYAYASDTKFSIEVAQSVKDCSVLYHEGTFRQDLIERAHETWHSTAAEAAEVAKIAEVKKLLLGHFSSRYKELDEHLQEAKAIFEPTELALEGNIYNINH